MCCLQSCLLFGRNLNFRHLPSNICEYFALGRGNPRLTKSIWNAFIYRSWQIRNCMATAIAEHASNLSCCDLNRWQFTLISTPPWVTETCNIVCQNVFSFFLSLNFSIYTCMTRRAVPYGQIDTYVQRAPYFTILFLLAIIIIVIYLFVSSRLKFWQLFSWCGPAIPTHPYNHRGQPQHRKLHTLLFSNSVWGRVPQGTNEQGIYLWDLRAYGLQSLSEKTWKSNQRQQFLLSYFKTLGVGPAEVELTTSRMAARCSTNWATGARWLTKEAKTKCKKS